jgi:hypothetical protein
MFPLTAMMMSEEEPVCRCCFWFHVGKVLGRDKDKKFTLGRRTLRQPSVYIDPSLMQPGMASGAHAGA